MASQSSLVRASARATAFASSLLVLCQCSLDGLSGGPARDGGNASADGATAAEGGGPVDASSLVDGGADCSVHADGKLHCTNTIGAALYALPSFSSAIVDHLSTRVSAFDCWGTGDLHPGGNTTWYRTFGNDNVSSPKQGWVQGRDLKTPDNFDMNPTAGGLIPCP